MTIRVTRGPKSTGERFSNDYPVQLEPAAGRMAWSVYGVKFNFLMDAGGRGRTAVQLEIPPEDFGRLAQAMMNANPEAATKAFGAALIEGTQLNRDDPSTW